MSRRKMIGNGLFAIAIFGAAFVPLGCEYDCADEMCTFNKTEWERVQELSPLPMPPVDQTNRYQFDDAAVRLGQRLFFETKYSGAIQVRSNGRNGSLWTEPAEPAGRLSCASCHLPQDWFIDTRTGPNNVSLGINYTGRNSPTIVNSAHYEWVGWAGLQDSLWHQAGFALENTVGGDRCGIARMLFTDYREEYDQTFDEDLPPDLETRFPAKCKPKANAAAPDGTWETMPEEDKREVLLILSNASKAIAAYETQLVSGDAPFDRYVAGETDAMSPEAARGLKLFIGKAACNECHNTPFFSDQKFHNLGIPHEGPNLASAPDMGRFADVPRLMNHPLNSMGGFADGEGRVDLRGLENSETHIGRFRTQSLRNIAQTAPYFHNGVAVTLRDAVGYYNVGGSHSNFAGERDKRMAPLELSEDEVDDLVAFLEALTGEPVLEELRANPHAQ